MNNRRQTIRLKAGKINSESRSKFYLTASQVETFYALLEKQFQIKNPLIKQAWNLIALSFEHPLLIADEVFDYWMAFKQIWPTPYLRERVESQVLPSLQGIPESFNYSNIVLPLEQLATLFCQKIMGKEQLKHTAIHISYNSSFGEKLVNQFQKLAIKPAIIPRLASLENGYWKKEVASNILYISCLKDVHAQVNQVHFSDFEGTSIKVLDLGMPCNLDPLVKGMPAVTLFNLDSIASLKSS